jgi:hypothetical protein
MQQNHSVSGSEISGCSQPYPGPPVDLRKAANGQSERMAAFGTAHFARERRGWAQTSRLGCECPMLAFTTGGRSGWYPRPGGSAGRSPIIRPAPNLRAEVPDCRGQSSLPVTSPVQTASSPADPKPTRQPPAGHTPRVNPILTPARQCLLSRIEGGMNSRADSHYRSRL